MDIHELLAQYGQYKGIGDLSLNKEGLCPLLVDDVHYVVIAPANFENCCVIYASLGFIAPGEEGVVAPRLLHANLFGRRTGRASFAYEPQTRTIVLSEFIDLMAMNLPTFVNRFNAFVATFKKCLSESEEIEQQKGRF